MSRRILAVTIACCAFALGCIALAQQPADGGEKGEKGKPGWYSLNRKVQSDGTVEIFARGIVPSSRLAAGNVPVGTPYGYPITGRLEGTKGTGARKGGRPCSVTFTKQ